ncbi:hypothetical protein AVEN_51819-1 [Araneus ventricosus]|uniref:Uncharacterized protein n=1 Tax=Araneus ventricosus TaxID=182803 RepID=A0A4Y2H6P1_ARAVE|nr:hypothetical protein AVEN_51819-1 [Araneus ventricosus]
MKGAVVGHRILKLILYQHYLVECQCQCISVLKSHLPKVPGIHCGDMSSKPSFFRFCSEMKGDAVVHRLLKLILYQHHLVECTIHVMPNVSPQKPPTQPTRSHPGSKIGVYCGDKFSKASFFNFAVK